MTAVYIPGWGQSLGNAASSVGQGIQQIVDPNYQFQQQFQKALADPQQAQQLANMYSTNPSVFDPKLYGQKNIARLSQIHADPNYQFEQQIQGDTRQAYNDPNNPSFKQNYIAKQAGVPNPTQQAIAQNTATTTGSEATNSVDAVKARQAQVILSQASPQMQEQLLNDPKFVGTLGMTPDQVIQLKDHIHSYNSQQEVNNTADKWVAAHPNALQNPIQIAKDILDGKIDTLTSGALQTDPKYAPGITHAIQTEQHNRDTLSAASALNTKEAGQDTRAQIAADAKIKSAQTKATGDDFTKTFLNVTRQLDDSRNPVPPQQAMQFAPLLQAKINAAYKAAGQDGDAPIITAVKEPTGFMGMGQGRVTIQYMSKDGKSLTVTDPTQLLPPAASSSSVPTATKPATTQADPVIQRITSIIDNKQGTLQQLMASPTWKQLSPQQQQTIQDRYKGGAE